MILTYGHGTASQADIVKHLRGAGVDILVDVRSYPGSRHNPHVGRERMAQWLPEAGISYLWESALGGRRKASIESAKDTVWRNASFRNYAGHMRSKEFQDGITWLVEIARFWEQRDHQTAIMCSESVWWRCHRRMISDFLVVARGGGVCHLMHDGRIVPHVPTEGIRVRDDGLIVYDGQGVKVSVK